MRVVEMPRSAGKTTFMVKWLKAPVNPREVRVLIVADKRRMESVLDLANGPDWKKSDKKPAVEPWRVVPAYRLRTGMVFAGIHGDIVVGIDELPDVLSTLIGRSIGPCTMTAEVEHHPGWISEKQRQRDTYRPTGISPHCAF